MWRRSINLRVLACSFVTFSVALVSCASGQAPSSNAGSGKGLGTITVITSVPEGLPYIGVNKGNELGAWDDSDLSVDVIGGSSPSVLPTVASGDADIGLQSANKAAADIAKGLDATIVAASKLPWGQDIIVSNQSNIDSVEELRGADFGISGFGSGGHYATLKTARHFGWSKNEYNLTQLGGLSELTAALKSGSIDAFAWNPIETATLEAKGLGKVIGSVDEYVGDTVSSVFYVRNDTLKNRPKAVQAFFEGYFGLIKDLKANPQRVEPILEEWEYNLNAIDDVYQDYMNTFSSDGRIPAENQKGLEEAVKFFYDDVGSVDIKEMYTYWQDL